MLWLQVPAGAELWTGYAACGYSANSAVANAISSFRSKFIAAAALRHGAEPRPACAPGMQPPESTQGDSGRIGMDYLGLFCLGVFVGTVATFGMNRVESLKDWQTVLAMTLPAVLSGAAMVFIDRFKYSPAFGCYPLGLAAALVWAYTSRAVQNVKEGRPIVRVLALLHLAAAALVTVAAAFVATVPAYLQLRAEWEVSMLERVDEMRLMRAASRETDGPGATPSARGRSSALSAAPASAASAAK